MVFIVKRGFPKKMVFTVKNEDKGREGDVIFTVKIGFMK